MLYQDYNSTIRDIFRDVEGISQHGLEELYSDEVKEGNQSYAEAIVSAGLATNEDIFSLVSQFLGYELQVGEVEEIDPEILRVIGLDIARQYKIVPLYLSEGGIHFLSADPFNSAIIDDLTFALNLEIYLIVCDPSYLEELLEKHYSNDESTLGDLLGQVGLENFEGLDESKENELTKKQILPPKVMLSTRIPGVDYESMSELLDVTGKSVAVFASDAITEYVNRVKNPHSKPSNALQIDQFAWKLQIKDKS